MEKELKTSNEWQILYPEIRVLDPDGWDRKNWDYSWHEELISLEEYERRRMWSTCMGFVDKTKLKALSEEEMLRQAADNWYSTKKYNSAFPADRQSFIEGAKYVEERLFTAEDMIKAAKYGYVFHQTTAFPEHDFDDACINNTKQWLTTFNKKK